MDAATWADISTLTIPQIRHHVSGDQGNVIRQCDCDGHCTVVEMSYYFAIIGTRDNPLFELDFGTSKLGGDGLARFREEAKYMNQFIVHAALDMVEEIQWGTKDLYAGLSKLLRLALILRRGLDI